MKKTADTIPFKNGYADVNGLRMYYEIYGTGAPLVLLHGGGSTIQTSFGRIIPALARRRQVIALEFQAHGRTGDREADISFAQDAEDAAALLAHLRIPKADVLGFSNGATTALLLAARHPAAVNKLVAASAMCKRSGVPGQFWDFMKQGTIAGMPKQYKDAYRQVAPVPDKLQSMFDKCARRMINFEDITDEELRSIKAPVLFIIGDQDVMTPQHAVDMQKLLPNCRLAIIPGGHGAYIGEITTPGAASTETPPGLPVIERFLEEDQAGSGSL